MSELPRKLGPQAGQRLCLLDAPEAGGEAVRLVCSAGATIETKLGTSRFDAIIFWPALLEGLNERFATVQTRIVPDGSIWAVMPKRAFARQQGITFTRDQMQAAALTTDLVDNKMVSLTSQEYATRFVMRSTRRGA